MCISKRKYDESWNEWIKARQKEWMRRKKHTPSPAAKTTKQLRKKTTAEYSALTMIIYWNYNGNKTYFFYHATAMNLKGLSLLGAKTKTIKRTLHTLGRGRLYDMVDLLSGCFGWQPICIACASINKATTSYWNFNKFILFKLVCRTCVPLCITSHVLIFHNIYIHIIFYMNVWCSYTMHITIWQCN